MKMAKMLPEQAVVNKMCQNGYTEEQARQLLGGNYEHSAPERR